MTQSHTHKEDEALQVVTDAEVEAACVALGLGYRLGWTGPVRRALESFAASRPVAHPSPADVLLTVIQRLNMNPYSLTKSECISEIQAMRQATTKAGGAS